MRRFRIAIDSAPLVLVIEIADERLPPKPARRETFEILERFLFVAGVGLPSGATISEEKEGEKQ